MLKVLTIVLTLVASICAYAQGHIDISPGAKRDHIQDIENTGFLTIKQGTHVYKANTLNGLIVFEFKQDSILQPTFLCGEYFTLGELGYVSPKGYEVNSFYSPILDSIVTNKLNIINSIEAKGINDNSVLTIHQYLDITVDTTYTQSSRLDFENYDSYLLVKKTIGSYYLVHNPAVTDKDFYIKRSYLEERIKVGLEYATENILPLPIRRLNAGQDPTPSRTRGYTGWKLTSSYSEGGYLSTTYRRGSTYKTETSFNGKTSTSYYTQY